MTQNINANITHAFFFNTNRFSDSDNYTKIIKSAFPDSIKYNLSSTYSQSYIKDMQTAEKFLHGGGQTYIANRFFLCHISPDMNAAGFSEWCVMITYFPEVNQLSISFHYTLTGTDTDKLIVLRQSGQFRKYNFDGAEKSFHDLAIETGNTLGIMNEPSEQSFLCEITKFDNITTIPLIEQEYSGVLYGIISGDEAYSFVPEDLIKDRLKYCWGSRDFIKIYAFGQGFLFLNLLESQSRADYLDYQHRFGSVAYGASDPYFDMGSSPLTVNHGILFSVEFVIMLKGLIDGVISRQNEYNIDATKSFYTKIKETRDFRRKIILVLERTENIAISEIGELSAVLLESQHIAPVVDRVKYLLELLESDLDLLYSERNNMLVTTLTVIGLVFAAIQIIIAFI